MNEVPSRLAKWPVRLVLTIVLVGGGVGLAAWFQERPATWSSTSTVLLRPTPGNAWSPEMLVSSQQSTIALATEASLVNSPPVIDAVNGKLDAELEAGTPRISASVAQNTQVLSVSFQAPSAAEAREGANAVADSFLEYRTEQSQAVQERRLKSQRAQLREAQSRLRIWIGKQGTANPAVVQSQTQLWSSRVSALQEAIGTTESIDTDPGRVVAPPTAPTNDKYPTLPIYAVGALIGLGMASLVIWGLPWALARLAARRGPTHAEPPADSDARELEPADESRPAQPAKNQAVDQAGDRESTKTPPRTGQAVQVKTSGTRPAEAEAPMAPPEPDIPGRRPGAGAPSWSFRHRRGQT